MSLNEENKVCEQDTANETEQNENTAESTKPAEEKAEKSEAEKLKEQYDALNDKFLRTLAEYDNFRKRSQREKDSIYTDAMCDTAAKLLPVVDSFERALSFECSDAEFKKGVEMINNTLKEVMTSLGITEIEAVGNPFDPNTQNAVMHVEDDSVGEDVVVEVFQKGYMLKGKVLRHAMVKVAN